MSKFDKSLTQILWIKQEVFFCVYIAYDTKRTEEFYYFRKKIHFKYILVERSAVTADSASLHAVDSKNFKAFIKIRMVIYFYL